MPSFILSLANVLADYQERPVLQRHTRTPDLQPGTQPFIHAPEQNTHQEPSEPGKKKKTQHRVSDLEQVEDLLAQVQLKVGVVGARHVVDEHQAVPLRLKAAENEWTPRLWGRSQRARGCPGVLRVLKTLLTFPRPGPGGRRAPGAPRGCPSCLGGEVWRCTGRWRPLKGPAHSERGQR